MSWSNSFDDQHPPRGENHSYRPRPTSPTKRDESASGVSRRRGSSPDPSDYSSRDGDDRKTCRSRIYDDCEAPQVGRSGDGTRKDTEVQVAADDIQHVEETQTSQSPQCPSPELPRRCSERLRNKTASKSWDIYSDCEQRQTCAQPEAEDFIDHSVQCDPRDIGSDESIQTGPSLLATGPFCRFDYKLKAVRPSRNRVYEDCECPCPRASKQILCRENRDDCSHFHQQVSTNDIAVSESIQTGEKCSWGAESVLEGKRRPPAHRKVYRHDALLDCECPDPPFKSQGTRNFTMQVKATNICPSKCAQTDPCLQPGSCLTGRSYRYVDWRDCCRPHARETATGVTLFKNFGSQVYPTDICDCDETQTGSSLCLRKPFVKRDNGRRSSCSPLYQNLILYGKARNYHTDDCARPYTPAAGCVVAEVCTQVQADQITASTAIQAGSLQEKVKKCFVRGGPWSCREDQRGEIY